MFFVRLRRGAKWVFVLLVFAFAFTFLFSGVGSGGSGGDIIQQLLGMRGTDPVKAAEKDVREKPRDSAVWIRLAQLYDGKDKRDEAIKAYEKFLTLKPKDTGGLTQLARLWEEITLERWQEYAVLQTELTNTTGPLDTASDPLQSWLGSDPLLSYYSSSYQVRIGEAYAAYNEAATSWLKAAQRYRKAIPSGALERAQAELQLGQAAASAGDYKTGIKAYKEFLRLAPRSPYAPAVRKALAELQKANSNG